MPSPRRRMNNSFKTMYKTRPDKEGQASKATRQKTAKMERKLRREKEVDKRRILSGMSPVYKPLNEIDQDRPDTVTSPMTSPKAKVQPQGISKETKSMSLKEKLQVWREEKRKQQEKKKDQPPAFVVKNIVYQTDFKLYREAPKNVQPTNELATTKAPTRTAREKNAEPMRKTISVTSLKSLPTASVKSLKSQSAANAKSVKSLPEASLNNVKSQSKVAKSPAHQQNSMVGGKPKAILVKGQLHSRLTASAAAKLKENTGKPKEFLRAKPQRITVVTRAQAKQERAEGDKGNTGGKKKRFSNESSFSETTVGKTETTGRKLRKSLRINQEGEAEYQTADTSMASRDLESDVLTTSKKEPDSQSQVRGSPSRHAHESSQMETDPVVQFSEYEKKRTRKSGRKSTALGLSSTSSEEEQTMVHVQDKLTPLRRSRRSIFGTPASPIRTPRCYAVKTVVKGKEEQANTNFVTSSAGDVMRTSTKEEENPTEEDEQKHAPLAKRTRRSVIEDGNDALAKRLEQSVTLISTTASAEVESPVKAAPGKRLRRSIRKLSTSEEQTNYEKELSTPSRRTRRSVARPEILNEAELSELVCMETPGKSSAPPSQSVNIVIKEAALLGEEKQTATDSFDEEKMQGGLQSEDADTQMAVDTTECVTPKSAHSGRMSAKNNSSNKRLSSSNISSSVRKSGRKTLKSARRQSRTRARSLSAVRSSPRSRRSRSNFSVVSVSEEGTSNWKGERVTYEAEAPNSSLCENQMPSGNTSTPIRSLTKSTATARTSPGNGKSSRNSAYRLAKAASLETETGPLQELAIEKVEGETSFIEVPLDESHNSMTSTSPHQNSPAEKFDDSLPKTGIPELTPASNSSDGTEPFTPRKSCEVTTISDGPVLHSIEATPDLPPRLPVRGFKTPFQAPLSAVRTRSSARVSRRKTEHSTPSRSPEEMIKILQKSPMIEMTRRRSRHVSSPANIAPLASQNLEDEIEISPASAISKANTSAPELNDGKAVTSSTSSSASPEIPMETEPVTESSDNTDTVIAEASPPTSDAHVLDRVKYFRNLLALETDKLNELCKNWEEISTYTFGLGEEVLGQIRTAVGKAQLLIAQRFKQFSGLVDNCEFNLGEQKTRPEDLQGFWEMIYFQIEDVYGLFDQLKQLQNNNWEDKKSPQKLILKKKAVVGKATKPKGVSNFKAFRKEIMLRKAKKNGSTKPEDTVATSVPEVDAKQEQAEKVPVEFDGGFFKVTSPARTSVGKRATLSSHTNTSGQCLEATEEQGKSPPKPSPTVSSAAADKENQNQRSGSATPVRPLVSSPVLQQEKLSWPPKRLSYVPAVPSPLLKDTTGMTTPRKA